MKFLSKISILLNVSLTGLVIVLLAQRQKLISSPPPNPPAPVASQLDGQAAKEPTDSAGFTPQSVPILKAAPFRWSQLESPDYRTYVVNLRGIGCPEQTIRDIIAADLDAAIYASRREELKQKEQTMGLIARDNVEAQLDELSAEENAMVASLLGQEVTANPTQKQEEALVAVPLAFQNISNASGLDANQSNAIASIRQRFLRELGSQENPTDPAYRERWQKAQVNANSRLQGSIGMRAYQDYEIKARVAASRAN